MINDDTLIKICRNVLGNRTEWPQQVRYMKSHLEEMKLGFPGLGNSHLSITKGSDIRVDDIFIIDSDLLSPSGTDEAPVMLRWLGSDEYIIEGIGKGLDLSRDPDRIKLRWRDTIRLGFLPEYIIKVDVRPTDNGGPGYYYFFKSYRDFR